MFIQVELSDIYITEGLSKICENVCQCPLECGTNHWHDCYPATLHCGIDPVISGSILATYSSGTRFI